MKKIQIETIKKLADIQVIALNARFIVKVLKAQHALHMAVEGMRVLPQPTCEPLPQPTCDEDNAPKYRYDEYVCPDRIDLLYDEVMPFLDELVDALEGNDE